MVESKLLLTAERLRLNPRIAKGKMEGDRITIKALDDRRYLTVDELQWDVVRLFAEPRTVPDVVLQLIRERKSPPLRDFFELILKAHQAGILQRAASHGILQPAVSWKLKLPPAFAGWLGGIAIAAALVSAWVRLPDLSELGQKPLLLALVVGWVVVALAISLGYAFAASVLWHTGGDIYRPRLQWSWLVPRFTVNLGDLRIMNRTIRLQAHLARLAPMAACATALVWWQPAWAILPLAAMLVMLRPILGGVATEIITAARGHPLLDTSHQMLFAPNQSWTGMFRAARQHFDSRVVALRIIWGLLWVATVLQFGFNAAGIGLGDVWHDWRFWRLGALIFAGVLAAGFLAFAYLVIAARIRDPARRLIATRQLRKARHLRPFEPVTDENISAAVMLSAICQRLAPPERDELARNLRPVIIPSRHRLADFNRPPSEAWLIVSGAVDVFRRGPSGRIECAWQAIEGDLVGAENLIESRATGWRLKTRTPLVALAVSHQMLQEKVLSRLEPQVAHSLMLRVPFLRAVPLCRHWHPQALNRFASLSTLANFPDGEPVLRSGQDNHRLYMVYEGGAVITREGRRVATVSTGGFFGEIGMLQNSPTTAEVTASGPLSCLFLNKIEFLHFLSHNYEVALEVERISSKRLGHPIFPMSPHSFDVY